MHGKWTALRLREGRLLCRLLFLLSFLEQAKPSHDRVTMPSIKKRYYWRQKCLLRLTCNNKCHAVRLQNFNTRKDACMVTKKSKKADCAQHFFARSAVRRLLVDICYPPLSWRIIDRFTHSHIRIGRSHCAFIGTKGSDSCRNFSHRNRSCL